MKEEIQRHNIELGNEIINKYGKRISPFEVKKK
jgi:hypothetical protein